MRTIPIVLKRRSWTWHVAVLTYVLGWVTTWAALSSFYPGFRIIWIFTLPATILVLWTWLVEDEN